MYTQTVSAPYGSVVRSYSGIVPAGQTTDATASVWSLIPRDVYIGAGAGVLGLTLGIMASRRRR